MVQAKKVPETTEKTNSVTDDDFAKEFDRRIETMMPCEEFRISITDDVEPFCESTQRIGPPTPTPSRHVRASSISEIHEHHNDKNLHLQKSGVGNMSTLMKSTNRL